MYLARAPDHRRGLRDGPADRLHLHLRRRRHLPAGLRPGPGATRAGSRWASPSTPRATCTSPTSPPRRSRSWSSIADGKRSSRSSARRRASTSRTASPSAKDGNVYVTDSSNGRLLVIDANDQVVAQVGRGRRRGQPRPAARRDHRRQRAACTSPTQPARASSSTAPTCRASRRPPLPRLLRWRGRRQRRVPVPEWHHGRWPRSRVRDRRRQRPRPGLELLSSLREVSPSPATRRQHGGHIHHSTHLDSEKGGKDSEEADAASGSRLSLAVPCRSSRLRGWWTSRVVGQLRCQHAGSGWLRRMPPGSHRAGRDAHQCGDRGGRSA